MSAQVPEIILDQKETTRQVSWSQRIAWSAGLLACGFVVFILGGNTFDVFPTNHNLAFNLAVTGALLVAALWLRRSQRLNQYWRIAFAFMMASAVYPATLLLVGLYQSFLTRLNLTINTSQGIALDKLCSVVVILITILVLNKLSGADLGSVYVRRGNLKWGLSIGGLVWFNFATSALLFFATRFTTLDRMTAAVLWGLVFSFSNGFMEELWFRGIFLKRLEPVIGMGGSILVTSILFAVLHSFAAYLPPIAVGFYVLNTLTLGLACGYLMMKTNSIWGPALIHAAADLFLFVATLAIA